MFGAAPLSLSLFVGINLTKRRQGHGDEAEKLYVDNVLNDVSGHFEASHHNFRL